MRLPNFSHLGLLASLGLLGACSTPPPLAHKMAPTAAGTVLVFYRQSSGSLGDFEGNVVWQLHEAQWNGHKVETRWVAPQKGIGTLKRQVMRMPAHPLGAGQLDAQLLSRTPPPH